MRRVPPKTARAKAKGLRVVGAGRGKRAKRSDTKAPAPPPHRQGTPHHPVYTGAEAARQQAITTALALSNAGMSVRDIAARLSLPKSTVHDHLRAGYLEARSLERRHVLIEQRIHRQQRLIQAYWIPAIGREYVDPQTQKTVQVAPDPDAARIVMMADDRIAATAALDHKAVDLVPGRDLPEPRPFADWTAEEIEAWVKTKTVPEGKQLPRRSG